jgi:hypothetical protein
MLWSLLTQQPRGNDILSLRYETAEWLNAVVAPVRNLIVSRNSRGEELKRTTSDYNASSNKFYELRGSRCFGGQGLDLFPRNATTQIPVAAVPKDTMQIYNHPLLSSPSLCNRRRACQDRSSSCLRRLCPTSDNRRRQCYLCNAGIQAANPRCSTFEKTDQ